MVLLSQPAPQRREAPSVLWWTHLSVEQSLGGVKVVVRAPKFSTEVMARARDAFVRE
jgi:hypothetical protein